MDFFQLCDVGIRSRPRRKASTCRASSSSRESLLLPLEMTARARPADSSATPGALRLRNASRAARRRQTQPPCYDSTTTPSGKRVREEPLAWTNFFVPSGNVMSLEPSWLCFSTWPLGNSKISMLRFGSDVCVVWADA